LFTEQSSEPPCEHPAHGSGSPFHADGNPHYILLDAPCGHFPDTTAVVCGHWIATIRGFACPHCPATYGLEILTVLGPVGDFR
jgi:hypothetical protein